MRVKVKMSIINKIRAELEFHSGHSDWTVTSLGFGHGWLVYIDDEEIALLLRHKRKRVLQVTLEATGSILRFGYTDYAQACERITQEVRC